MAACFPLWLLYYMFAPQYNNFYAQLTVYSVSKAKYIGIHPFSSSLNEK